MPGRPCHQRREVGEWLRNAEHHCSEAAVKELNYVSKARKLAGRHYSAINRGVSERKTPEPHEYSGIALRTPAEVWKASPDEATLTTASASFGQ